MSDGNTRQRLMKLAAANTAYGAVVNPFENWWRGATSFFSRKPATAPAPVAAQPVAAQAPAAAPAPVAPAPAAAPVAAPAAPAAAPLVMRANQGYGWLAQELSRRDPKYHWNPDVVRTALGNRTLRAGETIDTSKLISGNESIGKVDALAKATYGDPKARKQEESRLRQMIASRHAAQAKPAAPAQPAPAVPTPAPAPAPVAQAPAPAAAPAPAPQAGVTLTGPANVYGRQGTFVSNQQMDLGAHDVSRTLPYHMVEKARALRQQQASAPVAPPQVRTPAPAAAPANPVVAAAKKGP